MSSYTDSGTATFSAASFTWDIGGVTTDHVTDEYDITGHVTDVTWDNTGSTDVIRYKIAPTDTVWFRIKDEWDGLWPTEINCEWIDPPKENEMNVYRLYGINVRTRAFIAKEPVFGVDEDDALNLALLEHGDEIKLTLGAPKDLEFKIVKLMSFVPVEDDD